MDNPLEEKKDEESQLNNFLTELVHIQDSRLIGDKEWQNLCEKYSLNEADFDKLDMLIHRHMVRASEYKQNERWDNAIVETERALLFSPMDNNIRLDLAELFLNRSAKYGYLQKDLQRAEHEVRDALSLEPLNRQAKSFQKELEQLQKMLQGKGYNKRIIPLFVVLIIALGAALFPQIRKGFQFLTLREQEPETELISITPEWEEKVLHIRETEDLKEQLNLEIAEQTLIRESHAGFPALSIAGYASTENEEYSHLELELLNPADHSLIGTIPVISEGDAPLRRGESQPFRKFFHLNTAPDTIGDPLISIKKKEIFRPENEAVWEETIHHSSSPLPQNVYLKTEKKFDKIIEGYDRSYVFYDLKIENKGVQDLQALSFTVQWTESEDVVSEKELNVVPYESLPFKGQSIQSHRIMFDLEKDMYKGDLNLIIDKVE